MNYINAIRKGSFPLYFGNSLVVACFTALTSLVISTPAAYSLARFKFRGKKMIGMWALATYMIPPLITLIPYYLLFSKFRLLNTLLAVILLHSVLVIPLVTWMMVGFISEIPRELEEAAVVDGCTRLQALAKITLPLVLPGLAATFIFSFMISWRELIYAVTVTGETTRTLPAAIYGFVSFRSIRWGELAAAGVLGLLPIVVLFSFSQKALIRGLTMGSLK